MESAKLLLEYIKVFMWPLVLLLVLVLYSDEVLKIISTREVDAFGLKIGGTLDDLAMNYEAEIASLKAQIEQLQSGNEGEKTELITRLSSISGNVRQDLSVLRNKIESPDTPVPSNKEIAMEAERQGFQALQDKNLPRAIEQFAIAKERWPNYHNVEEIYALLRRSVSTVDTPTEWNQLYRSILSDYSWGMPQDVRTSWSQSIALSRER